MRLIVETFRPGVLVIVCTVQVFLVFAGFLFTLMGLVIHSGPCAASGLLFFVPAVLLTLVRRSLVEPYRPGKHPLLLAVALIVLAYVGTGTLLSAVGLYINYSDSVPVGLYRETADIAAKYAAFCLSLEQLRTVGQAGLGLGKGNCPGGVSPILKPLIRASVLHPITLTARGIVLDERLLPNTTPKAESRTYAPLTPYPFGTYTAGLWAISTYNPDSYDSRYFGPVEQTAVLFHATPFFTKGEHSK